MVAEDINWTELEAEYVTTQISHRKLAEKYGMCDTRVSRYASKNDWSGKRERHASRVGARLLENDSQKKADRAARIHNVADQLLDNLERLLMPGREDPNALLPPRECKSIAGTLRDLAQVHGVKSDLDIREQEARIQALEKQLKSDGDGPKAVTVNIGGESLWQM